MLGKYLQIKRMRFNQLFHFIDADYETEQFRRPAQDATSKSLNLFF